MLRRCNNVEPEHERHILYHFKNKEDINEKGRDYNYLD